MYVRASARRGARPARRRSPRSRPIHAEPPPSIAFAAAAEAFAVEYHLMFGHVPSGYLNALGQPLDAETAAVVMFICVLGQPLVLAHLNGFSVVGLRPLPLARPC